MEQLNTSPENFEKENDDKKTVWVRLPQVDNIGDNMWNKKVQIFLKEKKCYEIKKTEMFGSAKDSIPMDQKSKRYLQSHLLWLYRRLCWETDPNLIRRWN